MAEKKYERKKDVTITVAGQELTIPVGKKVKEIVDAAGLEIPELKVDQEKCKGCGLCARVCETGAASGEKKEPHSIDTAKCIRCGECLAVCRQGAIVPA